MIEGELKEEKHESMTIRDLTWKNLAATRASGEALRSSWGDGSLHRDVAAKKVPKHVGAACGWCWGLKGLVDEEKMWALCDWEAQRGKEK